MGVLGLAVSPITVLLKMGGFLAVGTKNTFLNLCNRILKNDRFRFPRYIDDSKPLEIYDENLSAAKEFLMKFANLENPNILFFSSFNCNNPGYKDKLAFIIITKELFLLLSNQNEILWKIAIKDIQKIKLFYKNDNFRILFKIKNKNKRVLIIDKSDANKACNFFSFTLTILLFKPTIIGILILYYEDNARAFKKCLCMLTSQTQENAKQIS